MQKKILKASGWGSRLRNIKLGDQFEALTALDRNEALRAAAVLEDAGILPFPIRTFLNDAGTYTVEAYTLKRPTT